MEQFLLNLLKASLLGALAILLMLVSKPLWRERYRAKARCWLWLALAAFLLFPVDFSVKDAPVQAAPPQDYTLFVGTDKTTIQSTDHLFGDMAERSGQTSTQVRDSIIARPVTDPAQKATRYIPVTTILFYGYLAGAAAFLLCQGVSYVRFRRTVRRWRSGVTRGDYRALLQDTARSLNVTAPEMFVCEAISTPAVTGLFRPTLLLPHERYGLNDLRYILRHELCHLKRRDMLLKLVLLAANAMHWFNPVVYLMLRQADEDIELACDSAATDGLDRAERAAYSRTLLAAVQSHVRALPATTCFGGTVERLKRRITNVLGAQKKRGLGVVALVLALTLTAGCAVGWGERGRKHSDPFDGSRYNPVFVTGNAELTIGKNFRPLYYVSDESGTYFRLSREGGVNTVTMIYDGGETAFAPMESVTLTQENFDGTLLPDLDALRSDNKAAWRAQLPDNFDDQDPEAAPNLAFLLKQEDGTLYLCIGYHFDGGDAFPEDTDRIRWVYRLEKEDDTIYASMDDYAAKCVEDLKQGTMTYYTSENGNYGSQAVEDTVADVRVTQLELGDSLEGLSPEGTALELWYFQYEMKPTNEAGMQIDVIGGQEVTDDGYLNEHWTHYLTVLHHTSGEQTGYQIIGTTVSNDGLFYNGCGYGDEEKAYLHDFYVDYAGLNEPKMFIPNLLNAATDGYGRANQCEARLVAGDGYYYYVPITAWARSSDAEFWYSRYDTGSYFSVKKLSQSLAAAKAEWESTGAKAEKTDTGWRFVTNEGMSSTVITLFDAPDNTCYEVEIHWSFDGSTAENEWGWNRDRAVEGEAEVLRAMVKRFTVTAAIQSTQNDADSALDAALKQLGDTSGEVTLSLSVNGTDSNIYDGSTVINRAYFARQLSESLVWREANDSAAPSAQNCILLITADGGVLTFCESQPMHLWLTTPDGAAYCFKTDSYDELSIVDGDGRTLYNMMRLWYDEAEYDALLRDVKPQSKSFSWQEAAQHWADAYYGAHTKAASGSSFKYTWVKALITPAEDTTKAMREWGEIDENTYCFYVEVQFTPESETALYYAMAGNTVECTDPSAPKGAYAFYRCCTIQLQDDGRWHGVELGTGW
ncbi:MAG: M56 family metallopeptidase [Oscillospiraceae bacterium]|nr:M56 family metallopeptidase [Oscillospiraceae bacterium]